MVSAPVKSAPVNDPKNEGMPGAKVRIRAELKSGTIIIPPGMRSIVRLMGTCMRAVLPEDGKDAPIRRAVQDEWELRWSASASLRPSRNRPKRGSRGDRRAGIRRIRSRCRRWRSSRSRAGTRLGDYEGAREREGLGLLGAQLAERVGGAE